MKKLLILDNGAFGLSTFFYYLYKKNLFKDFEVHVLFFSKYAYEISKFRNEKIAYSIFHLNDESINQEIELSNGDISKAFYSELDRFWTHGINGKKTNVYFERVCQSLVDCYADVVIKNNIDFIVWENISNSFSYIFYLLSKKSKVKFISISHSRINNRFKIVEDSLSADENFLHIYKEINNVTLSQEEKTVLDSIENYKPSYEIHNRTGFLAYFLHLLKFQSFKRLYFDLYYSLKHINNPPYQYGHPILRDFILIRNNIKNKIKRIYREKLNNVRKNLIDNKFIFYAMHYHPEASTSVYAMDSNNELENILRISRLLPKNTYLLVKEHPSQLGCIDNETMKRISQIPFVRMYSGGLKASDLIKKSIGVFTCTGTVGFEAILLGKPLIISGNCFYSKLPNVLNINSINNSDELSHFLITKIDETIKKRFLKAYFKYTYPGVLNFYGENDCVDEKAFSSLEAYFKKI